MDIDELPEDLAQRVRMLGQLSGINAEDPEQCRSLLELMMSLNRDQRPEREDVDRDAGDWDSDDPADDNNPMFEYHREQYLEHKAAALRVVRLLDRAYALRGRGEAIEQLEQKVEAIFREAAPDEEHEPFDVMRYVMKAGLKDNLAPAPAFRERERVARRRIPWTPRFWQKVQPRW